MQPLKQDQPKGKIHIKWTGNQHILNHVVPLIPVGEKQGRLVYGVKS